MGLDPFRELLGGTLADLLGHLRLHHVAGALLQQIFQGDAVDHVEGVQHVALGLGHLLAFFVTDKARDVDGLERDLRLAVFVLDEVHGHHDHPGNPEEDDVEAAHQHVGRVEGLERLCVVRPAQGGEGPQGGAEPGVEHVFVLTQRGHGRDAVLGTHFRLVTAHVDVAGVVIPGRDAVTPPQLTGDAPVLNVAHPGEVHVLVLLGYELDAAIFHRFDGGLGHRRHAHVPLVGQHRLDGHATAIAVRLLQHVILDFSQQAQLIQLGHNGLAGGEALHTGELARQGGVVGGAGVAVGVDHFGLGAHVGVQGEDVDHRQVVALAHFVVVEVVGRGDLHAAGALLHVGVFVGDYGDQTVHQRQQYVLADQRLVTGIFRVHGHGGIAQHGLRTGGGDDQVILTFSCLGAVGQRIAQVPHVALDLAIFHFQIGDGGVEFRIPVHQTLAAVHQAIFVETDEHFLHGGREAFIHGEALALPVHGVAQAAHLAGDGATGLFLPLPDLVDEGFTAVIVAGLALFGGDLALNHHLGGDTGVVGARLPQGVLALHAVVTDQGVHQGLLEGVTHVQAAGDVRRRDHDAEGVFAGVAVGLEVTLGFPVLIERLFDGVVIKSLFHGLAVFWMDGVWC